MENLIVKNERSSSLDLLRIIAMFMILTVHFLGWGGAVNILTTSNLNYFIIMPIYFICGLGNTLFFMLAGFFAKKPKIKKALFIERKTAFYCFLITLIVFVFSLNADVGIGYTIKSLFPIIFNKYWFVSVYIVLYILSFVLIPGFDSLNKPQFLLVILLLLIHNVFIMDASYTIMEGLLAYAVGYYIKKFKPYENIKKLWIIVIYVVAMGIYVGERFIMRHLGMEHTLLDEGLRYVFLLVASLAMFMFFAKLNIKRKCFSKISGNVLSVYLISSCPAWATIIYTKWLFVEKFCFEYWFVFYYLAVNVAIFAVCVAIDKLVTIINNKEVKLIETIYNKLFKKKKEDIRSGEELLEQVEGNKQQEEKNFKHKNAN